MVNPALYRLIGPLEAILRPFGKTTVPAESRGKSRESDEQAESGRHRAVVVGYGPVGRTLARLLRENAFEPVIIEGNADTVRALTSQGIRAIHGDAAQRDTLEKAGIAGAVALVLSSSSSSSASEVMRIAREQNPKLVIFARSGYLSELPELRNAGADLVFAGEGEIALAMTESLLRQLGATPEQIDRERARIRSEFGGSEDKNPLPQGRLRPPGRAPT
jgi:CPA2 family monovalent cation:H+ antiporter-2